MNSYFKLLKLSHHANMWLKNGMFEQVSYSYQKVNPVPFCELTSYYSEKVMLSIENDYWFEA